MLNPPIICKALGILLHLEALLLAVCFAVGFFFGQTDYLTFGVPVAVASSLAFLLSYLGRKAENRMSRRDGYLIVSLTWIVFSLIGTLPFIVSGHEPRFAAAFFETMSGFTTTGATAIDDVDALPHSILLWRSLTHWLGGMGIVFFTTAILPGMGMGDQKLFSAEATGLKLGKLHPRISTTARWLWSLYLLLTVACGVSLYAAGMSAFDAVNHSMSTIATGGFSTHTASMAYFKPHMQYVETFFMFLAGINFTLLYLILIKGRIRDVLHDGELRCYIGVFLCSALVLTGILFFVDGYELEPAFRAAFFNTASLQTTTGFSDEDFMAWHPSSWLILTFISIVGACAGSTSGGLKIVRVLTSYKLAAAEFRQILHPHAVLPIRIGNQKVGPNVARTLFVFFVMYFILILTSSFLMTTMGLPLLDAFGLAISSFSNVGPSIGRAVGPLSSWGSLNDATLWLNSFLMLAGRLEIFSLLIIFSPAFWKDE